MTTRRLCAFAVPLLLAGSGLPLPAAGQSPGHEHHAPAAPAPLAPIAPETGTGEVEGLQLPDVEVVDQDGRTHRFPELVRGRKVAVNFVFTTCTTICPPLGATFGKLRQLLGDRAGRDVDLISVSVDPATDTPERLRAWAQRFGAGPGWTLVTGQRDDVTRLLKAFGVYTPNLADHTPLVLIGDGAGRWTRTYGLAAPARLAELIDGLAPAPSAPAAVPSAAQKYFGDTVLVDQDGREHRLYSDLMQGRTVIMDFVFTRCTGVCPVLSRAFQHIQEHLGDRLGKDVYLLSVSVDPAYDTPARLKEYAARFQARPGWLFLTGAQIDVETVLRKLGQQVQSPEQHQNLILLGNDRTGLWHKAFGLAPTEDLLAIVDNVADDRGEGR